MKKRSLLISSFNIFLSAYGTVVNTTDKAFRFTICRGEKYQLNNHPIDMLIIIWQILIKTCYVLSIVLGTLVMLVSIKTSQIHSPVVVPSG